MPVQSSIPTVTVPSITFKNLVDSKCELRKQHKELETELKVVQQKYKILEAKNTELENRCTKLEREKTENGRFVQLVDENLQSSKRVLQCVCAIAGAILGAGFVLAFPPAGAAIALAGTGPAAAGVALVGGATGGCLVAPIVHEKTNNALIQQVQNFKAKEEVSKKAE